jgi:transposase-like protein
MADISAIKNLPQKRMDAIVALLNKQTVRDAAQAVGVGETTLYRWLHDSTFQEAYREAKYEIVQQTLSQLQKASGEAARVLQEIMNDSKVSAYTRVAAARIILETSIKAVEIDTLQARITKLEEFIGGQM